MKIYVFIKSFITFEEMLPFIFELKNRRSVSKLIFVINGKKTLDFIRENEVLFDAVKKVDGSFITLSKDRYALARHLYNGRALLGLILGKRLILQSYFDLTISARFLIRISRIVFGSEVWACQFFSMPYDLAKNAFGYHRKIRNIDHGKTIEVEADRIFLSHPRDVWATITGVKVRSGAPDFVVGFVRGLPAWRDFINEYLCREAKRPQSMLPRVFVPLSVVGSGHVSGEDCSTPKERLISALQIMKRFEERVHYIFRPHVKTDVSEFTEILDSVGLMNSSISYTHASVLANSSIFCFSYHSTAALVFAYYEGCRTVEYGDYDSRFYGSNDRRARYLHTVDDFVYKDPEELAKVFNLIISAYESNGFAAVRQKRDLSEFACASQASLDSMLKQTSNAST